MRFMASKDLKSAWGKMPLFEILDITKAESELTAYSEVLDTVDVVVEDAPDCRLGDFPATAEILDRHNRPGWLWYVLDDRGRVGMVH